MDAILLKIKEFFAVVWAYVLYAYDFLEINYVYYMKEFFKIDNPFNFLYVVIGVLALLVFIIVLSIINRIVKKKKVTFYVDRKKYLVSKCKHKKDIIFPSEVKKEGMKFVCWCTDKHLTKEFSQTTLTKNKNLKLYAKFEKVYEFVNINKEEKPAIVIETKPNQEVAQTEEIIQSVETSTAESVEIIKEIEPSVEVEENVDVEIEEIEPITEKVFDIGEVYDSIRYEMLTYERAIPFKQIGVSRKHIIAEMFEKGGKIYLYLAVDPSLMREKGYNVLDYQEPEFKIVPCKMIIDSFNNYEDVVAVIKEAMLLNNFVKSDVVATKKVKSDENMRKSGFAFYVKNDKIATSSSEYYILLRSIVLSYKMSASKKHNEIDDKNMILKIFKKSEKVYLYLALNAEVEGLEFVGYDKNFMDTPAKFEINTAEDFIKAQALIDKLMFRYGMEKHPEQTEIDLSETVEVSCGFGYKIRR